MQCKITQYGLRKSKNGWETEADGDDGTDAFKGNANNVIINGVSCALSPSAKAGLGVQDGRWLLIKFPNEVVYRRQVADSTSSHLLDARVDFFNAYAFDKQMDSFGQFAEVEVEEILPTEIIQHPTSWLSKWL